MTTAYTPPAFDSGQPEPQLHPSPSLQLDASTRTTYLRHQLENENTPPPQPNRIAPKHRSDSIRNQSHKTLPHQNTTPTLLHPTRQTHTFPLTINAHPSSPPPRHPAHHSLPCRTMTSRAIYRPRTTRRRHAIVQPNRPRTCIR